MDVAQGHCPEIADIARLIETHLEERGVVINRVGLQSPEHDIREFRRQRFVEPIVSECIRKDVIRFGRCKPFQRAQAAFEPHPPHPFGQGFTRLLWSEFAPLVEDSDLEFKDALGTNVEAMTCLVVPYLEMVSKTLLVAKAAGLIRSLVIDGLAGKVPFPKRCRQSTCNRQWNDIFSNSPWVGIHVRDHLQLAEMDN